MKSILKVISTLLPCRMWLRSTTACSLKCLLICKLQVTQKELMLWRGNRSHGSSCISLWAMSTVTQLLPVKVLLSYCSASPLAFSVHSSLEGKLFSWMSGSEESAIVCEVDILKLFLKMKKDLLILLMQCGLLYVLVPYHLHISERSCSVFGGRVS